MNDNWWTMKMMIEEKEREIRARIERVRPWLKLGEGQPGGRRAG
jgi:hypothetical protein